jgi:hypothetical protein
MKSRNPQQQLVQQLRTRRRARITRLLERQHREEMLMKAINKFDEQGNFIFWEDPITGTGESRFAFMPADIVKSLIRHILEEGRPLETFPRQQVARHQWGEILAEYASNPEIRL